MGIIEIIAGIIAIFKLALNTFNFFRRTNGEQDFFKAIQTANTAFENHAKAITKEDRENAIKDISKAFNH